MRHRLIRLLTVALVAAGCSPPAPPPTATNLADRSDAELAAFLPTLADYAMADGDSWVVQQQVGAGNADIDHQPTDMAHRAEPDGCDDAPYARTDNVAAAATGREINLGPVGFGGEASIRIVRHPAASLLDDTRSWATRCRDTRLYFSGENGAQPLVHPTAISVLPPADVDGIEVLRIHLTDNRQQRFQTEGSRERVVSLALVRGVGVYGYSHDAGDLTDQLMALSIRRLLGDAAAASQQPRSTRDDTLAGRSDVEIAGLLPPVTELGGDWVVTQALPVLEPRVEYYRSGTATDPPGCDTPPFINTTNLAPRADIDREFREVATATAARPQRDRYLVGAFDGYRDTDDTVRLNIEQPGVDLIAETATWAQKCGAYDEAESPGSSPRRIHGVVESVPADMPSGVTDATSVHLTQTGSADIDFTASLLRIRGLLVITLPAVGRQSSPLLDKTLTRLRTAVFPDTATPNRPPPPNFLGPPPPPAGRVPLPAPTVQATETLRRVASGTPVDGEQYHLGGYMPGDAKVRSPDTLYFHSPTGSINCVFRQHYGGLMCDVPDGDYPRNTAPPHPRGTWFDHYVHFDGDAIDNGVSAHLPRVYAETAELRYGSTIRLKSDAPNGDVDCLMATDGLICVNYRTRVGLHLSRDDLTPLVATGALAAPPS